MKRIFIFFLTIFILGACEIDTKNPVNNGYEITYENCGIGKEVDKVIGADTIKELPVLFSDEYKFLGWYKDLKFTIKANIDEKIETDITLYAKWEKFDFSELLEFSLSLDGTYYILRSCVSDSNELYIPATYKGLPVKEVEGLMGKSYEMIYIPSSVEVLNDKSFSNMPTLKTIVIGSGLREVSKYALCNVPKLESIVIDPDNIYFDSAEGVNAIIDKATNTLVKGCKSSVIPNGVKIIERYAFYGCKELEYIILPETVEVIKEYAFYNCLELKWIVLPKMLTTIGESAFFYCGMLKTIYNNSSISFAIGDISNGFIALKASNIYNIGEWSFVNGTPTPNN